MNGSQVLADRWTEDGVEHLMIFFYDETGAPIGFKFRTSGYDEEEFDYYFYEKNLFGDIVAIYDETGRCIGTYTYDAWGNCHTEATDGISPILQRYNPFRYRGYFYDYETGLYYLQSRYYNPQWGRFLNADALSYLGSGGDLLSFNLYAYCGNNPVMGYDPTGTFNWGRLLTAVAVIGLTTAAVAMTVYTMGTAMGVSATMVSAAVKLCVISGVTAGTVELADQIVENGDVTDIEAIQSATFRKSLSSAMGSIIGDNALIEVGVECVTAGIIGAFSPNSSIREEGQKVQEGLIMEGLNWAYNQVFGDFVRDLPSKLLDIAQVALPNKA